MSPDPGPTCGAPGGGGAMSSCCCCLGPGARSGPGSLNRLKKSLQKTFLAILKEQQVSVRADIGAELHVCRECKSALRRYKHFRSQVTRSYITLYRSQAKVAASDLAYNLKSINSDKMVQKLGKRNSFHNADSDNENLSAVKKRTSEACLDLNLNKTAVNRHGISVHVKVKRKKATNVIKLNTPSDEMAEHKMAVREVSALTAPFKCDSCIVTFTSGYELRAHRQISHNVSKPAIDSSTTNISTEDPRSNGRSEMISTKVTSEDVMKADKVIERDEVVSVEENELPKKTQHEIASSGVGSSEVPVSHTTDKSSPKKDRGVGAPRPFKSGRCTYCGRDFTTPLELRNHTISSHTDRRIECHICHKEFRRKGTLRMHMQSHLASYQCDICGKVLNYRISLHRHMSLHSASKRGDNYCGACDKHFTSTSYYREHLAVSANHKDTWRYTCDACGEKFNKKPEFRRHRLSEHARPPSPCRLCPKEATELLCSHMTVDRTKNIVCEVCSKICLSRGGLKSHLESHGVYQKKVWQRGRNSTEYKSRSDYGPWSCDVCQKTFKFSSSLTLHNKYVHLKQRNNRVYNKKGNKGDALR